MVTISPCTQGRQLRSVQVGSFLLTEASYGPGYWLAPHEHDHASLVFLLQGTFRERVGRVDTDLTPQSLYVRQRGVLHGNFFGQEGARCLFIDPVVDTAVPDGMFRDGKEFRALHGLTLRRLGLAITAKSWTGDAAARLVIEGLVLQLVGTAASEESVTGQGVAPWLTRARDRLLADLVNPPSIAALAAEAGVHPSHVARAFRRAFGCCPGELLQRARIEQACIAMRDRRATLSQVAAAGGYADQSHFGRVFRKVVGTTPARFRSTLGVSDPA
jgi:AraC family transcriptional regulator